MDFIRNTILVNIVLLFVFGGCSSSPSLRENVDNKNAKTEVGKTKVHFYIENSGSMYGYVRGGSQFKDVLEHLMVMSKDEFGKPSVDFINSKIVPTGLSNDVSKFCLQLNPDAMNRGDTNSSDINDIFSSILNKTDSQTVSILFSDCIYSVYEKNALSYLNHAKNLTQNAFMDAIKKHNNDFSLVMLQCKSAFNGFYYDMKDQSHYFVGFRPYFVMIVGRTALVRNFCNRITLDKTDINGLLHKYMVSSKNVVLDNQNACVLTSDMTNARRIIAGRDALGIDELELPQDGKPVYFSVAVDGNKLFTDESYLKDTMNYVTTPSGLRVVKVGKVKSDGAAFGNCAAAGLENPYYLTLQTVHKTIEGRISMNLKYKLPAWIHLSSTANDLDGVPPYYVTFGLDYLMRGINDAFLDKNPEKSIFKMELFIKESGRGSGFPVGLVVVILVVVAIIVVSIKLKR